VTVFLWLPDLWILLQGQSAQGVTVLMVMHLAIAMITYNLLVHVAPVRQRVASRRAEPAESGTAVR
jgi:hypothetical protein